MKRRADSKTDLARPAGRRLRCFLSVGFALMAAFVMCGLLRAQRPLETRGPMHLWRVHGNFVNEYGKGIANVPVVLQQNGQVVYRTKTNGAGEFGFEHVSGQYVLHIDKANYSELSRQVIVGEELAMRLRKSTLYVIAGPSACTDDCSSVFTSESEFEKAIKRNKARLAQARENK